MAKYTGPKCKLCRREGTKLYLKGAKCLSGKCTVEKRPGGPGMHPQKGRMSGYGKQFREKQKVKRLYGMLEAQFKRFFDIAKKDKMQTGSKLLQLLERRLDNVLVRMSTAESRNTTRQLISHGHVKVNGKKVSIPSYLVKIGDVVELVTARIEKNYISALQAETKNIKPAQWIDVAEYGKGTIVSFPERSQIDQNISEQYIVEYYSLR